MEHEQKVGWKGLLGAGLVVVELVLWYVWCYAANTADGCSDTCHSYSLNHKSMLPTGPNLPACA